MRAWLGDDRARELGQAGQLAGAAGQHQPAAGVDAVAGRLQPVARQFEDLLDPRADDAHQLRLAAGGSDGPCRRRPAERRSSFALVGRRGDTGAVERLQAFGVGDR